MDSEIGQQIIDRFFEAVDYLISQKKLRGVNTLAKLMGVDGATLRKLRSHETHSIKPEFMYYLVVSYGVSAEWLLTGRGEMFFRQNSHKNR
jgi:hypothetical protein